MTMARTRARKDRRIDYWREVIRRRTGKRPTTPEEIGLVKA